MQVTNQNQVIQPSIEQPPVSITETHSKINFTHFLDPYISLLYKVGLSLCEYTWKLITCPVHLLTFVKCAFLRLLLSRQINFNDEAIISLINHAASEAQLLKDWLSDIKRKVSSSEITQLLKDLKSLNFEINQTLDRLLEFNTEMNKNETQVFPIRDKLAETLAQYQQLDKAMDEFLEQNCERLSLNFQNYYVYTQQQFTMTQGTREEIYNAWENLKIVTQSRLLNNEMPNKQRLTGLLSHLGEMVEQNHLETARKELNGPLPLRNEGNTCYLESVLQLVFSCEKMCEQLQEALKGESQVNWKKKAIHQELIQFFFSKQNNSHEPGFFNFFWQSEPSLTRLRGTIFNSGFHPDFQTNSLYDQHDAASMMELFVDQFFSIAKFKWQEHTRTNELPGYEFVKVEEMTSLQLHFQGESAQTLEGLMQTLLNPHKEVAERKFKINTNRYQVTITNEEEATASRGIGKKRVKEYEQWYRFNKLPDVLVLHLKRFSNQSSDSSRSSQHKNESPVTLPQNGVLDLTRYLNAASNPVCYKVKGYLSHIGQYNSAYRHFVAYVEKNGKYYYCDGLNSYCYREITKEEFLNQKDAYLVLLEFLPENSN